jgi:hypothetical protein
LHAVVPYRDDQDNRDATNERAGLRSRDRRDISQDYPPPGDDARREVCAGDFRRFCETYFPQAFALEWSEDHLRAIERMQAITLGGGLFALAMPRGSGKTTLSLRAALWALLYRHRRFVCLIAATEELARRLLKQFKTELGSNERLAEDFRWVCHPIRKLENNGRRCIGQHFRGQQTLIDWANDRLTFPTMPDEACDGPNVSGSTISVSGLTGALRGQSHALASGEIIRPELVILDDPQTRESAMSPSQSATRAAIIAGDVLGMAGPGQDIAAIMPCTVIREDDMAAEMLDRKKHPEWGGQRTKMVYAWPKNEKLWEEYGRLWAEGMEAERGIADAGAFYLANRTAMDEGAQAAWPARYNKGELSAIQHAFNLKLLVGEHAFQAEYQNDPLPVVDLGPDDLTPDQIKGKVNSLKRRMVPLGCNHLTAFIDVQGSLLYWLVAAWEDDFTGSIVDYGAFPDQKRPYFTLRDARNTLQRAFPKAGLEGRIYAGLEALTADLLTREWPRDDGTTLRIERCLIDANYGDSTAPVKKFCRQSPHSSLLTPSHGKGISAKMNPMAQWPKRGGERVGHNWRLRVMEVGERVRSVIYDVNFWKSFTFSRLAMAMGDRGSLSLFGDKPDAHKMLADHLCAEFRVRTGGQGRELDEWSQRPDRRDNHLFDCLVGNCVAASMQGVVLPESGARRVMAQSTAGRVSFAAAQKHRQAEAPAGAKRASFREMQKARRS